MIEVGFSEHAEARILERTELTLKMIRERLAKELYVEVATVKAEEVYKYIVLWDYRKKIPLLIILKQVERIWEVVTVYETMTYHSRRHGVMVLKYHINRARYLSKQYNVGLYLEKSKISHSVVRVDICVQFRLAGKGLAKRYRAIHKLSMTELEEKFQNSPDNLSKWLIQQGCFDQVEVPADSTVYVELWRTCGKGKREILATSELITRE